MRDLIVNDLKYFELFVEQNLSRIEQSHERIKNELTKDKIPFAKYQIFLMSLEILIAKYSDGISIDKLRIEYSKSVNYLVDGWDDYEVKFKKGRPQVIYDKYMLNQYCYMVWMLSFAILLDVSQKEINILKTIIENGNISDELIIMLLSHLTGKNYANLTKTTYMPFKNIFNNGSFGNIDSSHIKKYLDNWFKNTKLLTWHNYSSSIKRDKYYFGYWSFEAAAISCILDLDDSKYRDNQFYPKDLVDYCKSTHTT